MGRPPSSQKSLIRSVMILRSFVPSLANYFGVLPYSLLPPLYTLHCSLTDHAYVRLFTNPHSRETTTLKAAYISTS